MIDPTPAQLRQFLWIFVRPQKKWVAAAFVFALMNATTTVLVSTFPQKFIDQALNQKNWGQIVLLSLLLVLWFCADGAADFAHRICLRIGTERMVRHLRSTLFDRLLIFSQEQSSKINSGQALTHVINDVFTIALGWYVAADLVLQPLKILGLLGRLFSVNPILTAVCLLTIPLMAVLSSRLGKRARRIQGRLQNSVEGISAHLIESIRGLNTAHAFGQAGALQIEFGKHVNESYKQLVKLASTEEAVNPLTKVVTTSVAALLLMSGGYLVSKGHMTTGELVGFITAAGMIQQPLRQLNHVNVRLQGVLASVERLWKMMNIPLDSVAKDQENLLKKTRSAAIQRSRPSGQPLRFEGVHFAWPTANQELARRPTLINIDLEIPLGKRVALVGQSGAGKSTLSLLAMRFMDPTQGIIKLGDLPAQKWELDAYRNHFSWVSQDIHLFQKSVRDNLLFVKPEASDEELWRALDRAALSEFVSKLPQGLNTVLNERAADLSGGEKQRLAIARALLKDSPILMLDEATSQLDAHNEKLVQSALEELMRSRSVLLIAHRLTTVRNADEVVVMEQGRIIERGQPQSLLANEQTRFYSLWKDQHS